MPALYIPILIMLLRWPCAASPSSSGCTDAAAAAFWTAAFTAGSLTATLAQGWCWGGFIQGVTLKDGARRGPVRLADALQPAGGRGPRGGYALLGACWLIWRRGRVARARAPLGLDHALAVAVLLAVVQRGSLFVHPQVALSLG